MIDVNVSPARMLLESAIDEHQCGVINDEILDVSWLNELCESSETELPKTRAISAILLELGFVQIDKRRMKVNDSLHYVWYKEGKNINSELVKAKVRNFFDKDEAPF
jgi:transcription initiation factor IIE alpha subunit